MLNNVGSTFIANLNVFDVIICLFVMPLSLGYILGQGGNSYVFCLIHNSSITFACTGKEGGTVTT